MLNLNMSINAESLYRLVDGIIKITKKVLDVYGSINKPDEEGFTDTAKLNEIAKYIEEIYKVVEKLKDIDFNSLELIWDTKKIVIASHITSWNY
jgi:hypothetical protein